MNFSTQGFDLWSGSSTGRRDRILTVRAASALREKQHCIDTHILIYPYANGNQHLHVEHKICKMAACKAITCSDGHSGNIVEAHCVSVLLQHST